MRAPVCLSLLVAAVALAACGDNGGGLSGAGGGQGQGGSERPVIGQQGQEPKAAEKLGFPTFATKNTTRVGGADPIADAAAVAQAVFPGGSVETRPPAVAVVNKDDWRGGIAAAVLMAQPTRSPILLTEKNEVPDATSSALEALQPRGNAVATKGAQVIRVGAAAAPGS